MMGHKKVEPKRSKQTKGLKLLQARLPKDLVVAFRTFALSRETTVRALLEELIRERLKREGFKAL